MISIAPIVPRKWCRVRSEVSCMALGSRACSADHHLDARPITRSQTSNAADRCVTMMAVRPRFRMRPSISRSVLGSWAYVHSSSRSTGDWSRPHAQRQGVAPGLRTSCRWCRPRLGPSGAICRRSLRRSRCGRCR